jgi:hypothetical protein
MQLKSVLNKTQTFIEVHSLSTLTSIHIHFSNKEGSVAGEKYTFCVSFCYP